MAGNIVKWWKHKILGGYKQFSVQECTTDSEELMYHQVRASSSCSAPPDLLLVSERDNNIQLRSPVVNIITTPPGNASSAASKHQSSSHQHHQANHHHHSGRHNHNPSQSAHPQDMSSGGSHSKHLRISSTSNGRHGKYSNMQHHLPQDEDVVDAAAAASMQQPHGNHAHSRHLHHHKEERIRLEEFTCDVSVEGGKSSQPLQFSFTFYDLDGHHGKITKDDIVGIVYTIYESIGKSVVVPHCGSKTINVRLTVSPEGKSKSQPVVPVPGVPVSVPTGFSSSHASKLKKLPTGLAAMSKPLGGAGVVSSGATALTTSAGNRRQHRYRPRKLIKSDDEDDDSNSEKEKDTTTAPATTDQPSGSGAKAGGRSHHHQAAQATRYHHSQKNNSRAEQCCAEQNTPDNGHNTYENMLNLKCCKPESDQVDCPSHRQHHQHHQLRQQDIYMKQATQRVKMLRRARKQKYQDHCLETRQRSLSVGNDSGWQNRHLQPQQPPVGQAAATPPQPLNHKSASGSPPPQGGGGGGDLMLDGVQLRQPRPQSLNHQQHQQQRKSAECWKSALNRNDLISIIRESMEKNRLCFQLNGKPQANVSPIRQPAAQQQQQQRQRCNTGSKIPTLIANHSPVRQPAEQLSHNYTAQQQQSQQMIGMSHQQEPTQEIQRLQQNQTQNLPQQQQHHSNNHHEHPQPHIPIYHQQLAINPAVLAAQQTHNTAHNKLNLCGYDSFLHATICGGGAAAHSPPATPSNVATVQPIPKKSQKKEYKNYGNLIYAKLSEQLEQKDREQRRQRHKQQHQKLQDHHKDSSKMETRPPTSNSSSAGSKIYGDALECAHLLASEEEDLPPSPQLTSTPSKVVSTDTLIDLNDDVGEAVAEAVTNGGKSNLEAEESGEQVEVELDTSASSSMIHRYVHEHIHHHYHHFKEQLDV